MPFVDWFRELPTHARDKVLVRIERLRELGHELRRPEADSFRDGIYELRATPRGTITGSCTSSISRLPPSRRTASPKRAPCQTATSISRSAASCCLRPIHRNIL